MSNTFIKGMDISSYPEIMDRGFKYYDYDGNEVDLIDFAVSQGFNYGRLRIWNEPQNIPEARGYCDLEHTKRMALEMKRRKIGFLLDFHYSDFWADPGKQIKPKAWENLNNDELVKAVYDFTKSVLTELDNVGAYPDMVQVGNEIRCGMIWPEGKTDNWHMLARLINAGIKAVRDTQKQRDTKVMIHLDQGGRYYYLEEWFDNCLANGVTDFDIIGLSYYGFWHGTYNDLKNSMEKLVKRYNKPLIIAEAAHGYRTIKGGIFDAPQEELSGFPADPEGQKAVMELVMGITANISENKGLGMFYWEPFSMSGNDDGSWGSCMGMVDQRGIPTEGLKAFNENPYEMDAAKHMKLYAPNEIKLTEDMVSDLAEILPKTIKALRLDGNIDKLPVNWEVNAPVKPGLNEIKGVCDDKEVIARIEVVNESNSVNLAVNGEFKDSLDNWHIEHSDCVKAEVREKISDDGMKDEYHYLYIKGNDKFLFSINQKIHISQNGKYRFLLSYMGDNTTGVNVSMYAMINDGKAERMIFPEEIWHEYYVDIDITQISEQQTDIGIEIGLKIDSPISYGSIKDIKFIRRG